MAAERLQVILELVTGQYKKEAREAATSTQAIGAAAEKTGTEVGKMERTTETAGKKMTDFGKVAVAALSVAALGAVKAFVQDSVRAFSDLNESMNALNVTFGENAEGIKKLGEEAANNLGLSNSQFNSFAVQMSAFAHTIAGEGGDVVGTIDEISTRVSDFASVMNLEVADAALLFQSGLAGETEPLRKYGIDLSAAAVEAHALAVGIVDSKKELGEQEKVLARYSLLMEQTSQVQDDFANTADAYANAARIAAAQVENLKARTGEALVPLAAMFDMMKVRGAQTLGIVTTLFQNLIGQIDGATSSITQWEILTGENADSLVDLVSIHREFGGTLTDLASKMDFAEGELKPLTESQIEYLRQIGYTQVEIDELTGIIDKNIHATAIQTEGARQLAIHQGEVAEETDRATDALTAQFEALRAQTDPLFNLIQKTNEAAESQKAVNDAAAEFGTNSPEYTAAALQLVEDNQAMIGAQIAFAEQSGMTRDEFETNLREMGITSQAVIDAVLAEFDRVNAYVFTTKDVMVNINGKWVGGVKPTGMPDDVWKNIRGFAGGGVVRAGEMIRAGEGNRPELMVIPGDNGRVLSNADTMALLRGGRGGQSLNITIAYPNHTGNDILAGVQRAVGLAGLVHFAEVTSGES